MNKNPNPRIIGFLCNWCAYAGADMAGVSRFQYPPNLRIIRVMCSGRIDPVFIFQAFKAKADGVIVLGCHPGDCHYQTGNCQAERKMRFVEKLLKRCGIEPDRFILDWVSAAEGARFAQVVSEFTQRIQGLPPIKELKNLEERMEIALKVAETERLRWLTGKEYEIITQGNVYHEVVEQGRFDEIMDKNIEESVLMQEISRVIADNPLTPAEVAKDVEISSDRAFKLLVKMEHNGLAHLQKMKGRYPEFVSHGERRGNR